MNKGQQLVEILVCAHCSSENVVKDGKNLNGDQKLRCKDCSRRSIVQKKENVMSAKKKPAGLSKTIGETSTISEDEMNKLNDLLPTVPSNSSDLIDNEPTPFEDKSKKVKKQPKEKIAKAVNDIYERGLYTARRVCNESGLEGKALKKYGFSVLAALAKNEIPHEIEQLTGRRWRRVFTAEAAHKYMSKTLPDWLPPTS